MGNSSWRWLSRFVIYHYDRWEIISSLKKDLMIKISFNFIKFQEKNLSQIAPTIGPLDALCLMIGNWTYSKILIFKNLKILKVNQLEIKPFLNSDIEK